MGTLTTVTIWPAIAEEMRKPEGDRQPRLLVHRRPVLAPSIACWAPWVLGPGESDARHAGGELADGLNGAALENKREELSRRAHQASPAQAGHCEQQ